MNDNCLLRSIIVLYNNPNISIIRLSKLSNITYCWLVKVIQKLEKEELITKKLVGRIKYLILTKKGTELAKHASFCAKYL